MNIECTAPSPLQIVQIVSTFTEEGRAAFVIVGLDGALTIELTMDELKALGGLKQICEVATPSGMSDKSSDTQAGVGEKCGLRRRRSGGNYGARGPGLKLLPSPCGWSIMLLVRRGSSPRCS
jgi:hypothetical protein